MNNLQSIEELRDKNAAFRQRLARCAPVLIGADDVGLQVSIELALLGTPRLTLLDDNVLSTAKHVKLWHALIAEFCYEINPDMQIITPRESGSSVPRSDLSESDNLVVFCATACCATRRLAWATCFFHALFFIDGRMSSGIVRVIAVDNPKDDAHYASTLRSHDEPSVNSNSARNTIGMAAMTAGLMVHQFVLWLRGEAAACDITMSLPTPKVNESCG